MHQAGIATPKQTHLTFAGFDLTTDSRRALEGILRRWSAAAAQITSGREFDPTASNTPSAAPADPGEALGLAPSRLTLTFRFGPSLFRRPRSDRLGLASLKPPVLEPLPALAGEALEQSSSGGDICVQACAEDQQVNFHAIHVLAMLARDDAQLRWSQLGFRTQPANGGTGRNLIGFKDGTRNLDPLDRQAMDRFVWVGTSTTRSTSARGMPQAGR